MNKFNKSAIAVFLLVATSVPSFAAVSVKKAIDAIPQAYILARAECPELEKASKAIRNEVDSDKVDAWEKQVPQEAWFKTWIQECSAEADKLMKNHNVREAQIVFYAPGKSEDKDVLGLYTKTLANPGKPTVSVASNQASSLFISKLIGFQSPADVLWVDYNVNC